MSGSVEIETALATLAAFVLSALLTGIVRRLASSHGFLDVPNERSSHTAPTPRGGGVAIVLATTVALVTLFLLGTLDRDLSLALGGGIAVAIVGFLDDRDRLPVRTRIAVHFAAALWVLHWLGGLPPLQFGGHVVSFGWLGYVLGALGIVWTLNLFNFMDGIDGIAASEAAFMALAGALLAICTGISVAVSAAALVFGAACCGFLLWNWPPAKIFMGDVGSGYLGFTIAVLAVAAARDNPVALLAWLALGAAFFVDATVSLVRRLLRGERVHQAHRSHAYQLLARRWRSHRRVTALVLALNVFWLLPLAWWCFSKPALAHWILAIAIAPLSIAVISSGAGRAERILPPEQ